MPEPEMTAEWHEERAHALLQPDPTNTLEGGLPMAHVAAVAHAHATLALALRLGPTPEERLALAVDRQDAAQAREAVRAVLAAEAPVADDGTLPGDPRAAKARGWLWLTVHITGPDTWTVTPEGRAAAGEAP